MNASTNPTSNEAKNGNKSKPQLCEDFNIYGNLYKIPLEKVEEANSLIKLIPGWMGMYVEEFKSQFGQYIVG